MSRRRKASSSEGGAGFVVLIILVVVVKFIWWIVGALALAAAFYLIRSLVRANRARQAVLAAARAQLVARADQQHDWVMQGDARGTYGSEGVTVMRKIFADKEIPPFGTPYDS